MLGLEILEVGAAPSDYVCTILTVYTDQVLSLAERGAIQVTKLQSTLML